MAAPVMTGTAPVGVAVAPNEAIKATCTDDVQVTQNSILVNVTDPNSTVHNAVIGGAIQAGWSGTITANGGNGYDITITPDDLMIVGAWSAYAYCEDGGAASDNDTWGWTVVADAPTIEQRSPIDIETDLVLIGARLRDDWGLDTTTLDMKVTPAADQPRDIIIAGAFQTGYTGSIIPLDDAGDGPREVTIVVRTWVALPQGRRLTFAIDIESVVGVSI
jgi:hypothetical protein